MADIDLVIKIPEEVMEYIKNNGCLAVSYLDEVAKAIKNGTPLPKGHENIYDENDIKKEIENPYQCQTVLYGLKLVKPIIEADKAESEE